VRICHILLPGMVPPSPPAETAADQSTPDSLTSPAPQPSPSSQPSPSPSA
jgi:hypothetical protein